MTKWEELLQVIEECKPDAAKLYVQGNSSAGQRLRKNMQKVRDLAKDVRAEIQEIRKV